jgi:SAM-dependent methyltransferase
MAQAPYSFSDGREYERFMGRWSETVGKIFIDWLMVDSGRRWLDVGCGTGVFTRLIAEQADPASIVAIDPSGGANQARMRTAVREGGPIRRCGRSGVAFSGQQVRRRGVGARDQLHS